MGQADPQERPPRETWPDWIALVGAPCWVCDAGGRIVHVNERAEELFGRSAETCEGQSCAEVIRGIDVHGAEACRLDCEVMCLARSKREIEPVLRLIGDRNRRWFLVLHLPLTVPDEERPWLVHFACDVDRSRRTEEYVRRIAARTEERRGPVARSLSPRELEILDLLALDKDPKRIARELHISPTTVRNHVQHVLAKLDSHSISEAVALHVLGWTKGGE